MPKRLEALSSETSTNPFPTIKGSEFDPDSLKQAVEVLKELMQEPEDELVDEATESKED